MKAVARTEDVAGKARPAHKAWTYRTYEAISGYGFVLPAVIAILMFTVLPILMAIVMVFMKYDLLSPPKFIGLDNITRIFTDSRLSNSYLMTLKFVVLATLINNILGMLLAMAINRPMHQIVRYLMRTSLFFPV